MRPSPMAPRSSKHSWSSSPRSRADRTPGCPTRPPRNCGSTQAVGSSARSRRPKRNGPAAVRNSAAGSVPSTRPWTSSYAATPSRNASGASCVPSAMRRATCCATSTRPAPTEPSSSWGSCPTTPSRTPPPSWRPRSTGPSSPRPKGPRRPTTARSGTTSAHAGRPSRSWHPATASTSTATSTWSGPWTSAARNVAPGRCGGCVRRAATPGRRTRRPTPRPAPGAVAARSPTQAVSSACSNRSGSCRATSGTTPESVTTRTSGTARGTRSSRRWTSTPYTWPRAPGATTPPCSASTSPAMRWYARSTWASTARTGAAPCRWPGRMCASTRSMSARVAVAPPPRDALSWTTTRTHSPNPSPRRPRPVLTTSCGARVARSVRAARKARGGARTCPCSWPTN